MELRPRIKYSSEEELQKWEELLNKAREEGPDSILIQYEGDECVFEGPFRTVEDVMKYHKIDPEKYIGKPVESTYWEVTMRTDEGHITVPNHRLKVKIIPKPLEVLQFKEFAEGLPKYDIKDRTGKTAHVIISDLHMGAVHKDYNLKKVVELLSETAAIVNSKNYERVIVHCLGDCVESFTGKSHADTWKNIEMWGVELIKESSKILSHFLDQINNLVEFTLVGGNHDRMSDKTENDSKAGAADMIAYILDLRGYPVRFDPFYLITDEDFRLIAEHGNWPLSKQNPYEKIFRLGAQDKYNIIVQGHDHSRQVKRSHDGRNYRQITAPSFIPSTDYGLQLGAEGTSGFLIIEGGKKPTVIDYML